MTKPHHGATCNAAVGSGKVGGTSHERTSRIPKYDTKKEDLDFLEW